MDQPASNGIMGMYQQAQIRARIWSLGIWILINQNLATYSLIPCLLCYPMFSHFIFKIIKFKIMNLSIIHSLSRKIQVFFRRVIIGIVFAWDMVLVIPRVKLDSFQELGELGIMEQAYKGWSWFSSDLTLTVYIYLWISF